MRGIKIPQQDFALKRQGGGAYAQGGTYLQDTTVQGFHLAIKHTINMKLLSFSRLPDPLLSNRDPKVLCASHDVM